MERPHELTEDQLIVAAGSDPAACRRAFASLRAALFTELAPVGELESLAVERIVAAHWTLRRCLAAEAHLAAIKGIDPLADENRHPALRGIEAVTRRAERTLERAVKLLRQWQTERELRRLAPPPPQASAATTGQDTAPAPMADFARLERSAPSRRQQAELQRHRRALASVVVALSRHGDAEDAHTAQPRQPPSG